MKKVGLDMILSRKSDVIIEKIPQNISDYANIPAGKQQKFHIRTIWNTIDGFCQNFNK